MAFEGFPDNAITIDVKPDVKYSSVFFPKPPNSPKPTILFLHGFPSSSFDWHNQITYFAGKGYGVIAPDLLGYGSTTAPTSLEPYTFKSMTEDIISILKHCQVDLSSGEMLHFVGHDFGAILLSTLLAYHPNIALTASFVAVPYTPPGVKLDLDAMKQITEKVLGFELFGYRRFFIRENSWQLIDEHKESFFTNLYGPEELMMSDFLPPGKLEAWLRADKRVPYEQWVTPEYKQTRDRIFSKDDSYKGPTDWYKARFRDFLGIDQEVEELGQPRIPCPAMFLQSAGSKMLMAEVKTRTGKFADEYEYHEAPSGEGHFVQLEAPDEVNDILEKWFAKH